MRHTLKAVDFKEIKHTKSGNIRFKTTPYRWLILLLFCGLILNLAMATVGFSSFVKQIKVAYGINKWPVVLLLVTPTILYAPMNFLSATLFAHTKINYVLKAAALL